MSGTVTKPAQKARSTKLQGHVPKRGRPSTARARGIDRAIIDAAREQFFAEGFDAVAMEQVAAKARVSKGTLYARHPSKEALFAAVIQASVQDWSDQASASDHLLTDDIEQRLRHHARTIALAIQQPDVQATQRLIVSIGQRFPQLAGTLSEYGFRYIVDLVAGDLAAAARRDGQALRDPLGVAKLLVTSISGLQLQRIGGNDGESMEAFADRVVDLILAARSAW
ncbi:MAG: TetR/AcrR family transcriptional regulator [Sphingomonadales bacterium]|nr:TetR/AcrR family transcriptional regulator [Sphingomonadales bacterium]